MLRLPFQRFVVVASGLLGLGAAICFVSVPPPSHFMDMALSFIGVFVGTGFIALIVISTALVFFTLVIRMFLSDD